VVILSLTYKISSSSLSVVVNYFVILSIKCFINEYYTYIFEYYGATLELLDTIPD